MATPGPANPLRCHVEAVDDECMGEQIELLASCQIDYWGRLHRQPAPTTVKSEEPIDRFGYLDPMA